MFSLRHLCLPLLGITLLAHSAFAQTSPPVKPKHKTLGKMPPRMVPNTTPAARAANPLRGTNNNGAGDNGYAAPGEPVNVTDNGKNTPSYDGPAPKPAARTRTTLASPK